MIYSLQCFFKIILFKDSITAEGELKVQAECGGGGGGGSSVETVNILHVEDSSLNDFSFV